MHINKIILGGNKMKKVKGFTLVELVITIAIVIILSVVSVPIYRGYVDKAKWSEGYALLGALFSAQKAYYSEYGNFLRRQESSMQSASGGVSYEPIFGIDARGNKYFTFFMPGVEFGGEYVQIYTEPSVLLPIEFRTTNKIWLMLQYNVTKGAKIIEYPSGYDSSWRN